MVAAEQISVACTIGILPQPFSVHDVKAKLGLAPGRVGLTMAFFEYCGLVTNAPGRGMYRATPTAAQVSEAGQRTPSSARRHCARHGIRHGS
jgi:hypothetical protein